MTPSSWMLGLVVGGALGWAGACLGAVGGQNNLPQQEWAGAPTNSEAATAAYLQLQEQIHATQLALERNRQEAEAAAGRNAELVSSHLRAIEQSLATQRAKELEEIQSSNRLMLTLAGVFAAVGLLALFGMAYFQWHTVSRLAEFAAAASSVPALGPGRSFPRLTSGEALPGALGSTEQANRRWSHVLGQLEQRIVELEQATRPPLNDAARNEVESGGPDPSPKSLPRSEGAGNSAPEAARIRMLAGKGQSLLSLGRAADALACLDEALSLEPRHAEALVKKGTALEQLGRLEEALECYERAIAADGSMTMAYLCQGGLFNRMQRFKEALECYELALHTQAKAKL
jgi:tetratricopeptide (TPR) repeat protein